MENLEERKPEINHDTPTKKRKIFSENCKINSDSTSSTSSALVDNEQRSAANVEELETSRVVRFEENNNSSPPPNEFGSGLPKMIGGAESPSSSEASESDWQPPTHGSIDWIQSQMLNGRDPRDIIYKLVPGLSNIPEHINNWDVWRLLVRLLSEPPRRTKLPDVNTFEDAIRLIRSRRKIMILTGAGVSVSCGIPDFRSRDGVYARLAVDFPDLPNPEAMFDITYFKHDPRPFFKFAKEIYPGQYKPSLIHRFISMLEKDDKLLRNYTQNIDTLEQVAGISRVIQCHGSFATASCQLCKYQVDCDAIREDIFNQVVPYCPRCPGSEPGILKPDIVFFGENLPDHFHRQMSADKDETDLLVVIGSALKVRPVALIPNSLPEEIPQILINREPLPHMSFDVELLGDGDVIMGEICRRLGGQYDGIHDNQDGLSEIITLPHDDTSTSLSSDVSDDIKESMASNKNGTDSWSSDSEKTTNRLRHACLSDPVEPNNETSVISDVGESNNKTSVISDVDESNNETSVISDVGESSNKTSVISDVGESNNETSVISDVGESSNKTSVISDVGESNNEPSGISDVVESKSKVSVIPDIVESINKPSEVLDVGESNKTSAISGVGESNNCTNEISDPGESKDGTSDNMSVEESDGGKDADASSLWESRWKRSVSKRLPAGTYYYDGGHRYIFPGAEVAPEEESDCSSSESSSDSSDDDDSMVSSGISPMQRHYIPRRSTSLQPSAGTSSNDDVSTTSLQSCKYRNEDNKMGELSTGMESDAGWKLLPRTFGATEQSPHCYVESTSIVTKEDASSSLKSFEKVNK